MENREIIARVKAWINIAFGVFPKYLGETFDLSGDGEQTWDQLY